MITKENIDTLLMEFNQHAVAYETYVITSLKGQMTYEEYVNQVMQETNRLGEPFMLELINYIYSIIWCYANIGTDDGDIIKLDKDYSEHGQKLVKQNPNLIGMYVFPLILYGAEYLAISRYRMPEGSIDMESVGAQNFGYIDYMASILEVAIQGRYHHLRLCHLQTAMGNDEFREINFGNEAAPEGRVITPSEEGL